jgi:hypothetical protein
MSILLNGLSASPRRYVRYTSQQSGSEFNSGAKQRIIRMVDVKKDPMAPPKFKTNKKIPRGPPSPPAPVMHSPPRKVTAEEQQDWKIPPCVSSWKNQKGYTIPLDKRMAADGRGLQDVSINDKVGPTHVPQPNLLAAQPQRCTMRGRLYVLGVGLCWGQVGYGFHHLTP